jgi:hypothetical protein
VPWCEPCERFFNPNSLMPDGSCPSCGTGLGTPPKSGLRAVPWHFWLLLSAVVGYLGWRLVQGVAWLAGGL